MKVSITEIIQERIKVLKLQRDNEELPQNVMSINFAINELERVLAKIERNG